MILRSRTALFSLGLLVTLLIGILWIVRREEQISVVAQPSCQRRPCNVILLIVDALSARHMGLYGYERVTTPFLDQMFQQGTIFLNAWSNTTWTMPSFASFFTSRLSSEIGVEELEDTVSSTVPTFIDLLRQKGVEMKAMSGSWNGSQWELVRFKAEEYEDMQDPLEITAAQEWIRANRKEPFLLALHTIAVHDPYDPPPKYRTLFKAPTDYTGPVTDTYLREINDGRSISAEEQEWIRRLYDQEIRYLDDLLQDFFSGLPGTALDNTVVLLTADHGEAFGEHGKFQHGRTAYVLYEELLQVPLLVLGWDEGQQQVEQPVSLLDLAPTILDLMGVEQKDGTFNGRSLLPLVEGETLPDEVILAEVKKGGERKYAARLGDWKLIRNPDGAIELYNLSNDSEEFQNLIETWRTLPIESIHAIEKLLSVLEARSIPSGRSD